MARLVVVCVTGDPERAFYDEAQAQEYAAQRRAELADPGRPHDTRVTLWDTPIGRSVGAAAEVEGGA